MEIKKLVSTEKNEKLVTKEQLISTVFVWLHPFNQYDAREAPHTCHSVEEQKREEHLLRSHVILYLLKYYPHEDFLDKTEHMEFFVWSKGQLYN